MTTNEVNIFIQAVVLHLIADWFFQNDWMAKNKHKFGTAMFVHSFIHVLFMLFVFNVMVSLLIGVSHALIDTRIPLYYWRRIFKQTTEGEAAMHVAIWQDQVLHVLVLANVLILID